MKNPIFVPWRIQRYQVSPRRRLELMLPVLLCALMSTRVLCAQQPGAQGVDPQNTQSLLQRIDQLEARLKEVETALAKVQAVNPSAMTTQPAALTQPAMQPQPAPSSHPPAAQPAAALPEPQTEPAAAHPETEPMDLNKTLLRIRGFGDVDLFGSNQNGTTTSFALR